MKIMIINGVQKNEKPVYTFTFDGTMIGWSTIFAHHDQLAFSVHLTSCLRLAEIFDINICQSRNPDPSN